MMMPSIFGENLFDDVWDNFPFNSEQLWGKKNPLYGNCLLYTSPSPRDRG